MAVAKSSQPTGGARRSRCLLSLDGGGIRGISSIAILREIMRHVNNGRPEGNQLQPWQVFDLIGGTSTGGIIAIMIGCLKMTLDECEEAYMTMAKEIFQPKRSRMNPLRAVDYIQANERFDSKSMERIIKDIIAQRTGDPNHRLMDQTEKQPSCKVFVTSVKTINQELRLLRNYDNPYQPEPDAEDWELWEAIRATSAANTYFQEHRKGEHRYVDGALKGNNPVYQVMMEADELWDRPDAVMVSIGTGEKTPAPIEGNIFRLASTLTKALINPGDTDIRFRRDYPILVERDLAYRFSVPKLGHVKLHDFRSIPIVKKDTELFFQETSMKEYLQRCSDKVRAFSGSGGLGMRIIEPRRLANLTQEEKDCLRLLHAAAGDYESQRTSIDKPVPGTCEWFLRDDRFSQWLGSKVPSLLWVTANPGCGKSVLSSFLVDSLLRNIPDAIICSFFFKAGEQNRSESCQALCALIHQLLTKAPRGIKYVLEMFSSQDPGLVTRNVEALWELLRAVMQDMGSQRVVFVVDALDECSEASRNRFIDILASNFPYTGSGKALPGALKIITTSRPWPIIERRFKHLNAIRLRGEDETRISADIEKMVKYKVDELSFDGTLSPEARVLVEEKLLSGADQTFLWVSLVFDKLSHLHSRTLKSIRKALEGVPNQLDQLFESALSQFQDRDASLKLLRAVVAAKHPLHLDGINIAMNINQDTENLSSLKQELEPNMEFTAKQLGGFFIRIIDSKVHLVHQTAREFLLQNRATDLIELNTAPVDIDKGDAELAEACVRFLTLGEVPRQASLPLKDDNLSELRQQYLLKLPAWARWFFSYAAVNWGATSGIETALSKHNDINDLVALLCDPNETLLTSWWLFYTNENLNIGGTLLRQEDPYFAHLTTFRGHLTITRKLVELKASKITDKDNSGRDLLLNAASNEKWEHIVWLLESFPWAELQYGEALIKSIWAKDVRIVTALIEAGTDLNKPYKHEGRDITPGQRAAQNPRRLELLLKYRMKVTESDYEAAVEYGVTESLKLLLSYDTRSRADVERTINAIFMKATEMGFLDCRDLMLERGADVPVGTYDISVGFEAAIGRGDMEALRKLLERGADSSSALKDAAVCFSLLAIETLLRERPFSTQQISDALSQYFEAHAGPDLGNHVIRVLERTLKSPNRAQRLHKAFTFVPSFGGLPEDRSHFFEMFLSRGGYISPEQFTRVVSIVIALDETFALFLLENIRELQKSNAIGQADFLTAACLWGKQSIVSKILSVSGVDVNKKDELGITPIFAAVASGNQEVVSLLLKHGANHKERIVHQQLQFDQGDTLRSDLTQITSDLVKYLGSGTALSAVELAHRLKYEDIAEMLQAVA